MRVVVYKIDESTVTIKQIQEQSGASLHIPKTSNVDSPTVRIIQITCPNAEGANLAKQLVEDVLKTKPSYGNSSSANSNSAAGSNHNNQHAQPQVSVQISIPDKDVGLCIGRGGCVIKYMQGTTQCRIQIPPTVQNPGDLYRIATILGPSLEACQQVQAMIHRILSEQSSAGVMSGNANATTHHHQQQQQQQHYQQQQQSYYNNGPQENQPGYSAEWAAYHAAQQQQQQQAAAATTQATTTAATVTSANAAATNEYTEPFFRYAYYYGEEAARQYYGAWSPPVGTPNPYGVNPNGITLPASTPVESAAAAAPAATATMTSAPATVETTAGAVTTTVAAAAHTTIEKVEAENRETSRRHVSNLPAWMTKKD
jgi:far upstream element-binding protein